MSLFKLVTKSSWRKL